MFGNGIQYYLHLRYNMELVTGVCKKNSTLMHSDPENGHFSFYLVTGGGFIIKKRDPKWIWRLIKKQIRGSGSMG